MKKEIEQDKGLGSLVDVSGLSITGNRGPSPDRQDPLEGLL